MPKPDFISYNHIQYQHDEMIERSKSLFDLMKKRRSIRHFSEKAIPMEVIKNCLKTAGTVPSGANQQPWKFLVVTDAEVKKKIREGAEKQEQEFYSHRAPKEWLDVISHLGTDAKKPFLENAPVLIVVFEEKYGFDNNGRKQKRYYPTESVGLATGLLITALHFSGLSSLTHTPSPMAFLNDILDVPVNYKPFLILITGLPAERVRVPNIKRKPFHEIAEFR